MPYNQNFELPTQRFGEVIPHDLYSAEQLRMFEIIEAFGRSTVAQTVELDSEPEVQSVELQGQYL